MQLMRWLILVAVLASVEVGVPTLVCAETVAPASSEASPAPAPAQSTSLSARLFFWVQDTQRWLDDGVNAAVEQVAGDKGWSAGLTLMGLSFVYGVLHAVGPGHGKAIISSYVLANERTVRRGIVLAFMSGFFQALTAIVLVGVLTLALHMSSLRSRAVFNTLETVSYGAITLFGVWLLLSQLRRYLSPMFVTVPAPHDHGHEHGHDDHSHGHDPAHDDHGHEHGLLGHAHLPGPKDLAGTWSWSKAIGLAFMVGLRPCLGALIVLGAAVRLHLYTAGVLATLAMGLGTAITVSILATMAVGSRDLATRLAGVSELWVGRVEAFAKLGGGAVMVVVGALFFLASLHPHPFG